jgi:hypothetical protein
MRYGKILGAAMIASVFAMGGCGKKGGGGEKEFESYVNAVCACKDMKCVTDEGAKFAEKNKGKKGDSNAKPSKKMVDLTTKMTDCTKKITEEEMKKNMPPAPTGDTAPPAGGDQAAPPAGDTAPPAGGDQKAPEGEKPANP